MDDADRATELEEKQLQTSLKQRKSFRHHDGYCLNCGAESPYPYCDADCRDDAERFERAAERDGRRQVK